MAKKTFKIRNSLVTALDDTVNSAKSNFGELYVEIVPIRKVTLDPENPRQLVLTIHDANQDLAGLDKHDPFFDRKKRELSELDSLANSIKEQGVINPIVVYKSGEGYQLIAGERRVLASIVAGKNDIPARILTVKPDKLKLSLIQWIENIEREDLSLWERIQNLQKIVGAYAEIHNKEASTVTLNNFSQLIGCSIQQAANYRYLLQASNEILDNIKNGQISNIEKAVLIIKAPEQIQKSLLEACLNGATHSELKKLSNGSSSTKKVRGRPTSKVNLGYAPNTKVAKLLIDTLLKDSDFHHFKEQLGKVVWSESKSVSVAFRKLLKLLDAN